MIPTAVYLILAGLIVLGVALGDVRERRRRRAVEALRSLLEPYGPGTDSHGGY